MTHVAALWRTEIPEGWMDQLEQVFTELDREKDPLQIFFRSDDIADVDHHFRRLMQLFTQHQTPLCLAVVPTWMDQQKWDEMAAFDRDSHLWCWHQHGYSHQNHEAKGKKCEFGNTRKQTAVKLDLIMGQERLRDICGSALYPVFTPPWNRCSAATLDLLTEMGFKAVSRWEHAEPPAPLLLPDLAVNVDLHTRKEEDPQQGWENLLDEFANAGRTGRIGIMLHHQLMNKRSFFFLDQLLHILRRSEHLAVCSFRDLLS